MHGLTWPQLPKLQQKCDKQDKHARSVSEGAIIGGKWRWLGQHDRCDKERGGEGGGRSHRRLISMTYAVVSYYNT